LIKLARPEWPLLAVLGLGAAMAWAFVELADEVVEGDTREIDTRLLLALRTPGNPSDPLGPAWLEETARDLTALGGFTVLTLLTLAAVAYLLFKAKRHAALAVFVAVAGGQLLSTLLKLGFDRPRPDLVPHEVEVYTASFPSGHSMMAAVTYLTLGALLAGAEADRRMKTYWLGLALLLTVLVGISRVYLGVHWPSDVLGGWVVGAVWAIIAWLMLQWLQHRGEIEAPGK